MWRSLLPGRGGGSLNAPRVDVVIPTRNRRSLVFVSIGDALHQEGVEVRCIVVDDGSTDSTAAAIEGEADPRVVLVSHPERRGVSASRNTGMLHSRAPWVAFLDDDDRWAPTKLSAQLAALEAESGARWAATGCVVTDATLHVTGAQALPGGGGEILVRLLIDCFIPAGGSSVLAARSLLDEAGAFDTQLGAVEDWDYWLRLARLSPIAYVHSPLVAYRRWPGNTSGNTALMERYRNEFKLRYEAERGVDPMAAKQDLRWAQWMARSALQDGRRLEAARRYIQVAWASRSVGQLIYAAASIGVPTAAMRRLATNDLGLEPEGWREDATLWLRS
jgi:glycosyltransferase involved in cell wall biosynthesis